MKDSRTKGYVMKRLIVIVLMVIALGGSVNAWGLPPMEPMNGSGTVYVYPVR